MFLILLFAKAKTSSEAHEIIMNLTAEPINRSDEHLLSIRNLVIDVPALQRSGYVVYKLSGEEIQKKRRCFDCSKGI